jgi:ABC-2 type transport system permease protein
VSGGQGLLEATQSEWIKLKSVRSTLYTLAVTIFLCVGIGALISFGRASHASKSEGGFIIDPTRVSLQGFSIAEISIGVIGVLIISSEYATGSIRATLGATPNRISVLLAKVFVLFAATLVVGEFCSFLSFFVGQAILRGQGASSASLSTTGALRGVLLAGLSLAMLAVFAMGLATMLRHTAGSITVYVALLLVTFLILAALPADWQHDVAKFLPEVLTQSMRAASTTDGPFSEFSALTSTLVLAGYAVASVVAGGVLLVRRDA